MRFSAEITLGTIVSIVSFLGVMIPLFMRLGRVLQLFETFPPHRHQGRYIFYPKGFEPRDPEKMYRDEDKT